MYDPNFLVFSVLTTSHTQGQMQRVIKIGRLGQTETSRSGRGEMQKCVTLNLLSEMWKKEKNPRFLFVYEGSDRLAPNRARALPRRVLAH